MGGNAMVAVEAVDGFDVCRDTVFEKNRLGQHTHIHSQHTHTTNTHIHTAMNTQTQITYTITQQTGTQT